LKSYIYNELLKMFKSQDFKKKFIFQHSLI